MTLEERAKDIRAVCDCLRYVQADINRADLPIVSLHIGLAISEAQTILDQLSSQLSATAEPTPSHHGHTNGAGH